METYKTCRGKRRHVFKQADTHSELLIDREKGECLGKRAEIKIGGRLPAAGGFAAERGGDAKLDEQPGRGRDLLEVEKWHSKQESQAVAPWSGGFLLQSHRGSGELGAS